VSHTELRNPAHGDADNNRPYEHAPGLLAEAFAWLNAPVAPPDDSARQSALLRQVELTKPAGSLGRLETLAVDFAGWQGRSLPSLEHCMIRVFAGDHGIVAEGVSRFPQDVTAQMITNFIHGGAAISVLAQQWQADFAVVSLGTVVPVPAELAGHPRLRQLHLAAGTGNICETEAMDALTLARALRAGADEIDSADTLQLFIGGEMGIGNTAVSAALASQLLDLSPEETVGRGTGVDDEGLSRKRIAVRRALDRHRAACDSPLEALRRLGGLEIAALTGAYLRAAQRGVPSLVDGFIATTAALLAWGINPPVRDWLLFAHRCAEPGHRHLLEALGAEPLLDLQMRLGEGSGAAVALPLLQSALTVHAGMATFAEAAICAGSPTHD
jgi:nicotinate-nucleotide--dimethylbenzimidazole phosphoribosyltransferase